VFTPSQESVSGEQIQGTQTPAEHVVFEAHGVSE